MAALAYLLLPITGLVAYLLGRDQRARFHGLQAIAFGLLWAVALYGASAISAATTKVVFGIGALVWLALLTLTVLGRDPRLPLVGAGLQRAARHDPRGGADEEVD